MMNKAISKDENGSLVYDWPEIDRAAVQHAIEPSDLRDYAFDYVTEELTAQQLIDAYRAAEEIE